MLWDLLGPGSVAGSLPDFLGRMEFLTFHLHKYSWPRITKFETIQEHEDYLWGSLELGRWGHQVPQWISGYWGCSFSKLVILSVDFPLGNWIIPDASSFSSSSSLKLSPPSPPSYCHGFLSMCSCNLCFIDTVPSAFSRKDPAILSLYNGKGPRFGNRYT